MKIQLLGPGAAEAQAEIIRFFREQRGVECIRLEGPAGLALRCPLEPDAPLMRALTATLSALRARLPGLRLSLDP
ncbi:hypothetical protein KKF91_04865 [Myxococcota bacterium]|nr:hypothetical protein [Myxococcota bacterium]MBU1429878.1 hypothetical protein [Myxococcota bacterium]MBU1897906.1 hypothetical protein [Myxococcota bacterium]